MFMVSLCKLDIPNMEERCRTELLEHSLTLRRCRSRRSMSHRSSILIPVFLEMSRFSRVIAVIAVKLSQLQLAGSSRGSYSS